MYEVETEGRRLKIGLHALNAQDGESVAAHYGVDAQTVAQCREAARAMHDRMRQTHGPRYWSMLNLARMPDGSMRTLGIGPSLEQHEANERRKRQQGL